MSFVVSRECLDSPLNKVVDDICARGDEIAQSLDTGPDLDRGSLAYNFVDATMDYVERPDRLPVGLEDDQVEDYILGRAVWRTLYWAKVHRTAPLIPMCIDGTRGVGY